jgi:hypothetical protein
MSLNLAQQFKKKKYRKSVRKYNLIYWRLPGHFGFPQKWSVLQMKVHPDRIEDLKTFFRSRGKVEFAEF